ncbi:hypothetical protein [Pollutimonas bauzanensis]|uniref:PXPV repeat-containing protein n=1 Tax=Pollutimonas bauzanensis TaxID=658167 RepID=A0A1M5XRX2_9BURK|nr:hypothetical protein [Pollutimonas bauzanensis]SHI02575.1 hypothetical protein SAMN04488135_107103 [Pollutimonas bauzanensis]
MKITTCVAKRLGLALTVLSMLGGCAIYGSTPVYYEAAAPVYAVPGTVYVAPPIYAPAPVYVDPWYVGPPVFLNFGIRSWGGGHYRGPRGGYGGPRWGGRPYRGR